MRYIEFKYLDRCKMKALLKYLKDPEQSPLCLSDNDAENLIIKRKIHNTPNRTPLISIFKVVLDRFNVDFCIIEKPYYEMEYWDTYSNFYSKSFADISKTCERIHFFKNNSPSSPDFDNIINELFFSSLTQQEIETQYSLIYYGFTTIRPNLLAPIGVTVIPPDKKAQNDKSRSKKTGVVYCKGGVDYHVNIGSTQMTLNSVPFIQSDTLSGCCATSSVWVASHILSSRYQLHKYSFSDITKQAKIDFSTLWNSGLNNIHSSSNDGLTVREIAKALEVTGARVEIFKDLNGQKGYIKSNLYTYVESGLPVVLCLTSSTKSCQDNHAVVAIGHLQRDYTADQVDFKNIANMCNSKEIVVANEKDKKLLKYNSFIGPSIDRYYVHNDNYGPFDTLDFHDEKMNSSNVILHYVNDKYDINSMIVAFPPYVKNNPDFIRLCAIKTLKGLETLLPEHVEHVCKESSRISKRKYIWRIILVSANEFKNSLKRRKYCDSMIKQYSKMHLPKYIWLCEYTHYSGPKTLEKFLTLPENRFVSGEFIFDTTTPTQIPNCLSMRYENILCTGDIFQMEYDTIASDEKLKIENFYVCNQP